MTRRPAFTLLACLALALTGCGPEKDPAEIQREADLAKERMDLVAQAQVALAAAHAGPTAATLQPLFALSSPLTHPSYGTDQVVFPFGPQRPISVNGMANLILRSNRKPAIEAAMAVIDTHKTDAEGQAALRWALSTLSEHPLAMLASPVVVPGGGEIGYIECPPGPGPGQAFTVDEAGLQVLLPYLRKRLDEL